MLLLTYGSGDIVYLELLGRLQDTEPGVADRPTHSRVCKSVCKTSKLLRKQTAVKRDTGLDLQLRGRTPCLDSLPVVFPDLGVIQRQQSPSVMESAPLGHDHPFRGGHILHLNTLLLVSPLTMTPTEV